MTKKERELAKALKRSLYPQKTPDFSELKHCLSMPEKSKPSYSRFILVTCCFAGFMIVFLLVLVQYFTNFSPALDPLQTSRIDNTTTGTVVESPSSSTISAPTHAGVQFVNEVVSYDDACNKLGIEIKPAAANQGFKEYVITVDSLTQAPSKLTYIYEAGEIQLALQGKLDLGDEAINYKSHEYCDKTILVNSSPTEISLFYEIDSLTYFAVFRGISLEDALSIFGSVI